MRSLAITAGGDFHPAPRTFAARLAQPDDADLLTVISGGRQYAGGGREVQAIAEVALRRP
jgi:hypothetical protein